MEYNIQGFFAKEQLEAEHRPTPSGGTEQRKNLTRCSSVSINGKRASSSLQTTEVLSEAELARAARKKPEECRQPRHLVSRAVTFRCQLNCCFPPTSIDVRAQVGLARQRKWCAGD